MLTEREEKLIQKYCLFPQIAITALIMALVLGAPFILLEMIDDLVFHDSVFKLLGSFRFPITNWELFEEIVKKFLKKILLPSFKRSISSENKKKRPSHPTLRCNERFTSDIFNLADAAYSSLYPIFSVKS